MRYHMIYLTNGERAARELEACDAASAVALVAQSFELRASFELLSVVPDAATQGWDALPLAVSGTPADV